MDEITQTQEVDTSIDTEQVSEGTGEEMQAIEAPVEEENMLIAEEEIPTEESDPKDLLDENAHEHLSDDQIKQLDNLLSTLRDGINLMSQDWLATAKAYKLNNNHMTALGVFNSEHAEQKPEDLSEEDAKNWDYMNGLNALTEEDVKKIFPEEDHPIYGLTFEITKERIHDACKEFFELTSMKKEYEIVHEQYSKLLEENEEAQIAMHRILAEAETDPELKAQKIAAIEKYYYWKYLKWMREPIDPAQMRSILNALSDADKVMYYNNRCRAKLEQLKISPMIILEINKFENNHLDEKYWPNQGVLVLYFMTMVAYSNISRALSDDMNKIRCMIIGLDRYIRKSVMTDTERDELTQSIIALEEQFLGKCPVPKTEEHVDTPPTTDIPEVADTQE